VFVFSCFYVVLYLSCTSAVLLWKKSCSRGNAEELADLEDDNLTCSCNTYSLTVATMDWMSLYCSWPALAAIPECPSATLTRHTYTRALVTDARIYQSGYGKATSWWAKTEMFSGMLWWSHIDRSTGQGRPEAPRRRKMCHGNPRGGDKNKDVGGGKI